MCMRACRDPEPFDWYQRYSGLKDLIGQYIKKTDHMLMAGCGNSRLTEDMFEDGVCCVRAGLHAPRAWAPHADLGARRRPGFTSIANVDISKVVIDQMAEKYRDKAGLTCAWRRRAGVQIGRRCPRALRARAASKIRAKNEFVRARLSG